MTCADCLFWQGASSTYQAPCEHPQNARQSMAFDDSCARYQSHAVAGDVLGHPVVRQTINTLIATAQAPKTLIDFVEHRNCWELACLECGATSRSTYHHLGQFITLWCLACGTFTSQPVDLVVRKQRAAERKHQAAERARQGMTEQASQLDRQATTLRYLNHTGDDDDPDPRQP